METPTADVTAPGTTRRACTVRPGHCGDLISRPLRVGNDEQNTHPTSEPFGTPVTKVGLWVRSDRGCIAHLRWYAHHGHWVVVFAQSECKVLQEVGGDFHEIILGEPEHVLDLVEDMPSVIGLGAVEGGGRAHRCEGSRGQRCEGAEGG